jgi:hypothetical protein
MARRSRAGGVAMALQAMPTSFGSMRPGEREAARCGMILPIGARLTNKLPVERRCSLCVKRDAK